MRRRLDSEDRIVWVVLFSWLPVVFFYNQATEELAPLDYWLGLLVMGVAYGLVLWYLIRAMRRPLLTLSNLLLSMQEGDYGLRARKYHGLIGDVLRQTNDLAETLKALRIGEREAHLLLSKMIAAIDLAVFIFDHRQRLTLANPQAEQLMLKTEAELQGRSLQELGLEPLKQNANVIEHHFPGGVSRWRVRHFVFYQDSLEHELLAVSDVGRLLVAEERSNWQKLLRVLGHELNNSLVPIKNMAQTLEDMLAKEANTESDRDLGSDLENGLRLIGKRADALHRFIQGYARLTRLPPPRLVQIDLAGLLRRISGLENLDRVELKPGPDVQVMADEAQIEQVVLNLLNNAVDATVENAGKVCLSWEAIGHYAKVVVEDHGAGIANSDNLFVPFFTTKTNGSGIGLVLSKQIVESHQGQLTLQSATDHEGAVATVLLPIAA